MMKNGLVFLSFLLVRDVSSLSRICGLNCENGGHCAFVADADDELALLYQSGEAMQKCICPEGFGGTGCEIALGKCNLDDKTCPNGMPCALKNATTNEYTCDCAEAEKVSNFAAMMCWNSFTEYCGNMFDPTEDIPFCTNGGKCKGSIIAAQIAPGNTSVNQFYRNYGCLCPREFYGPHCEFLKYDRVQKDDNKFASKVLDLEPQQTGTYSGVLFIIMAATLVIGCLVYRRRLQRYKRCANDDVGDSISTDPPNPQQSALYCNNGPSLSMIPSALAKDPLLTKGEASPRAPFVGDGDDYEHDVLKYLGEDAHLDYKRSLYRRLYPEEDNRLYSVDDDDSTVGSQRSKNRGDHNGRLQHGEIQTIITGLEPRSNANRWSTTDNEPPEHLAIPTLS